MKRLMKIAITGSNGLLGWHSQCYFFGIKDIEIIPVGRHEFNDDEKLSKALSEADAVIHLAGKNRGKEDEVAAENVTIAKRLVEFLDAADATPHVVFSSSTQVDKGNPYGVSKIACAELISEWSDRSGATFSNIIFPHLFGEFGKPFYNSVVSTFCHLVATGGKPDVENDSELNLLHCQDAAQLIHRLIETGNSGEIRPEGKKITVSELLSEVTMLAREYEADLIPNLSDGFRLRLFNTYRSFIPHQDRAVLLTVHSDERGYLFESVKSKQSGQTFFSKTVPGVTRGNHFHTRKVERFLVLKGEAVIRIRRMFCDEISEYKVSGDEPTYIDMPTFCTHNITNVGKDELLTLFWVHEIFDSGDSDTYFEEV